MNSDYSTHQGRRNGERRSSDYDRVIGDDNFRAKEQIVKALAEFNDGATRDQILAAVCARHKTARYALKELLHRHVIARSGYGTRNFPFRYHLNLSAFEHPQKSDVICEKKTMPIKSENLYEEIEL